MHAWTLPELLGRPGAHLDEAFADLWHRGFPLPVDSRRSPLETVAHASGSPATGGLFRVYADAQPGQGLFVKVLHHVRHWPMLAMLPEDQRDRFATEFPWDGELALWSPVVQDTLPAGLRAPRLVEVVDLGDDRLAVWMELVVESPDPWDLPRYARAAHALGRWNARSRAPEVLASCGLPAGYGLGMYAREAVSHRGLLPLENESLWAHPWLAPHGDLRATLRALGTRIDELLSRLDAMEQALPHGDASPQNLLVPADDPETFVAIDIAFRSPHALGFDLGQLLVGLVHAGAVPAADLPAIADAIGPAYVDGLRAEGWAADPAEVLDGFAISALLRSGFDGFRYDLLGSGEPGARHEFDERVVMARFLVDRAGSCC